MQAIAERLAKHDFEPPKELREKPVLEGEQYYLVTQFIVLHRTRGQGFSGPAPITLETCQAFLNFWPQWDTLKFVETMLLADQLLLKTLAEQREAATKKQD